MYDLHCHILPSIDDGAHDIVVALEMAHMQAAQGVEVVACTPHILPGLYHNNGPDILRRVEELSEQLVAAQINLTVVGGADNHITPTFVKQLGEGHLLPIGESRYVLVEPPHHVAPERLEELFFNILVAGYVPILTHPERLTWIEEKYDVMMRLVDGGVWMQITSGSLLGRFGKRAKYWGERMVCEGRAHVLASDAHDCRRRPPDLGRGAIAAEKLVGSEEAQLLVVTRPAAVLNNSEPATVQAPVGSVMRAKNFNEDIGNAEIAGSNAASNFTGRLWRIFR